MWPPVATQVPPRRRSIFPPAKVQLSDDEKLQARKLERLGHRQHREEARELLEDGVDPQVLEDLRVSISSSLQGDHVWGAPSEPDILKARKRVAHLAGSALWVVLVWDLGDRVRVPMVQLGHCSGLGVDRSAWRIGGGVDERIQIRRMPEIQLELFPDEEEEEAPGFWAR